jgi:pyruvate dehydrogenase E2 component (dihydrolipoamide acetyltransferase)
VAQDLLMPKLGLTMIEGSLAEWLMKPGQRFKRGDALFVVETEKVANEIEASADGLLDEILVAAGETVAVGTVVARWSGIASSDASAPAKPKPKIKVMAVVRDLTPAPTVSPVAASRGARILATPYARRLAREAKLDLATLHATRARITAADVRCHLNPEKTIHHRGTETQRNNNQ